jgi:hypothetical protein
MSLKDKIMSISLRTCPSITSKNEKKKTRPPGTKAWNEHDKKGKDVTKKISNKKNVLWSGWLAGIIK